LALKFLRLRAFFALDSACEETGKPVLCKKEKWVRGGREEGWKEGVNERGTEGMKKVKRKRGKKGKRKCFIKEGKGKEERG